MALQVQYCLLISCKCQLQSMDFFWLMNCAERLVEIAARLTRIHASRFITFHIFQVTYHFFIFSPTVIFLLHPRLSQLSLFCSLLSSVTRMLKSPTAAGFYYCTSVGWDSILVRFQHCRKARLTSSHPIAGE